LLGVAKQTTKSIHLGPRPRRAIHAPIHLNALTVKAITRLTLITALSGNTTSTRSGL